MNLCYARLIKQPSQLILLDRYVIYIMLMYVKNFPIMRERTRDCNGITISINRWQFITNFNAQPSKLDKNYFVDLH